MKIKPYTPRRKDPIGVVRDPAPLLDGTARREFIIFHSEFAVPSTGPEPEKVRTLANRVRSLAAAQGVDVDASFRLGPNAAPDYETARKTLATAAHDNPRPIPPEFTVRRNERGDAYAILEPAQGEREPLVVDLAYLALAEHLGALKYRRHAKDPHGTIVFLGGPDDRALVMTVTPYDEDANDEEPGPDGDPEEFELTSDDDDAEEPDEPEPQPEGRRGRRGKRRGS